MKKIAFIGTHGIGKTTLTHDLVSALKKKNVNAEFLGEIVRNCPLPINEETSRESQLWILHTQIAKELELGWKCDWLVCDRSVLDSYVYYFHKFGRDIALENLVKQYLKTYDLLVRVPINPDFLKKDGVRSVNPEFQKDIDRKMFDMLEDLGAEFIDFTNIDFLSGLIIGKSN